ncbi:AAA family ATPase [uncultured Oscillibacter sp.]|jgi:predicted ATP-dependent endonuclease of OLD family|uniref:ATP-dependent nuclease n=1 Tax=uncultured Oscillibacter sp. TaxID=876091 RepID=UPI0026340CDB|nr:AAA family ATPase [uncultured Oscillibacter sp.]
MKIDRLKIVNYKLFQNVTVEMNDSINIFVGENDSGKTTILEALSMALTGKVNGSSMANRLNLDWFNAAVRTKFKQSVANGEIPELPSIEIEVYFCSSNDDEVAIKKFKGTNNSLHEDVEGVKMEIVFDTQYSAAYKQLLSDKKIKDIPIEYYKINFRSFANPEYYIQTTAKRVACIDTTKKDYGPVLNRFVAGSINEYLSENDVTELRHAYRANRYEFTENQAVKNLNSKLQASHSFDGRTISLNLRETGVDEWKSDMSISLDGIPLENSGFGTQNMFKSEIFLLQNSDVDILIFEEPENNLSYANMSILISKLSESSEKQLFISTHSSFVANKLGLQHLHLVANNSTTPFKALKKDTYDYFLKLPGYNTLRILLANEAILVEGPADELIIQRAYMDNYGKQPIEFGIDVIAVDSLAFQRYCELASLICKHLTIVTDNDGNANEVINRYKKYGDLVTLCIEQDDSRRTLEPSVLAANIDSFEEFRAIIYQGKDIRTRDAKSILNFMLGNKTEWSMRVFTNEKNIVYPQYILKAIGITNEGKDDNEASADE